MMCCCAAPNVNGEPGYRWQPTDPPSIRRVAPPTVGETDTVVYDEPGRCGGLDAHSHHFRVTHAGRLFWQHGGGTGSCRLSGARMVLAALSMLDSNARYWLLHAIYQAHSDGTRDGRDRANEHWHRAAVEKRIKLSRRAGTVSARVLPAGPGL